MRTRFLSIKKKTLVYVLVAALVLVPVGTCYYSGLVPEGRAEASLTLAATALLFLVPLLAAGAGYAVTNYNRDNIDAFAADCQSIFDDISRYCFDVEAGKVQTDRLTRDDARAWSALGTLLESDDISLSTAMLNTLSKVFGGWAAQSFDDSAQVFNVASGGDATALETLMLSRGFPADKVSQFFSARSSCVSFFEYVMDVYNPDTRAFIGTNYYYGGFNEVIENYHHDYTENYVSPRGYANYIGGVINGTYSYSLPSATCYSISSNGSFSYSGSLFFYYVYDTTRSYFKMHDFTIYGVDSIYMGDKYIGDTVASVGQYQAIDKTWANDYGVNSRDDTIDGTTAVTIPNVGTIEDLLAALGEVATVDEMQAIIDKAIADAIAGSIDVPQETTDNPPIETDKPVVVPGDAADYVPALDMTTLFPFCIPFDLFRAFKILQAPAEAPVFEIPFKVDFAMIHVNEVWEIDMADYDVLVQILRVLETVAFCVGLILITRNIIKG